MSNETLDEKLQDLLDGVFRGVQTLEACLSLIKAGANPCTRGSLKNKTALSLACSSVSVDFISIDFIRPLLELGSDVNQKNDQGITPLLQSAWLRNIPMMKVILEFSPNVHLTDNVGDSVFDIASKVMGPIQELEFVELLNDYVLKNELASSKERSSSIESSFGVGR